VLLKEKGESKMAKINSVEELDVFKRAHKVTLTIYEISGKFPADEKFGLASQMRRAAASIPTNLIEGSYRLNRGEYRQFVGIARGSSGELKYHVLLAKDLGIFRKVIIQLSEPNWTKLARC
jgi:four helix bundle protein